MITLYCHLELVMGRIEFFQESITVESNTLMGSEYVTELNVLSISFDIIRVVAERISRW